MYCGSHFMLFLICHPHLHLWRVHENWTPRVFSTSGQCRSVMLSHLPFFFKDVQMMFSHLFLILSLDDILPPWSCIPLGVWGGLSNYLGNLIYSNNNSVTQVTVYWSSTNLITSFCVAANKVIVLELQVLPKRNMAYVQMNKGVFMELK